MSGNLNGGTPPGPSPSLAATCSASADCGARDEHRAPAPRRRATTDRRSPAPVRSCILIFYYGGPSHLDTWDMKPDAPSEVRGEFRPIATSVPGIQVCEHLPRSARVIDRLAIIRSLHHPMTQPQRRRVRRAHRPTPRRRATSNSWPTTATTPPASARSLSHRAARAPATCRRSWPCRT